MKKIIIFSILIPWYVSLTGQNIPDSLYSFSGYVLHATDSIPIRNAHILNLDKGTGTISGEDGSFFLMVRENDSLKFSCVGFRDRYMVMNAAMMRRGIRVLLQADTIQMEEVRISPLPPRHLFPTVFLQTKLPEPERMELNLLPMIKSDPGNVPATGIHFTGPVQLLYNAFNKKARLSRKLKNNRKKYAPYLKPEAGDSLVWEKE